MHLDDMVRECRLMPEIHKGVLALMEKVKVIHGIGAGSLPVLDLFRLLDFQLESTDITKIEQRGAIVMTRTSVSEGRFENRGEKLKLKHAGVTITIPELIAGTYVALPGSISMCFDSQYTISGGVLFFSAKLEDIHASKHRIDIDLSGDSFDQCIVHAA